MDNSTSGSKMPRYHGFTCPKCGSHYFGTYTHDKVIGPKYPHGTKVGICHANQYNGNGCQSQWDRADLQLEDQCIYEQGFKFLGEY